jgi:hypothetical protein
MRSYFAPLASKSSSPAHGHLSTASEAFLLLARSSHSERNPPIKRDGHADRMTQSKGTASLSAF